MRNERKWSQKEEMREGMEQQGRKKDQGGRAVRVKEKNGRRGEQQGLRRRDHHGVRRKRNKMQEDGGKIGGRMEGKRRSLEGTEWKEQQKGGKERERV